ncbi:MAG: DUF3552 domain-containing protein, partial [Deltaproteobacteria bacterium]|nr:DUF3552 domain-containing protein [Deltaproteobacteria bacterium]
MELMELIFIIFAALAGIIAGIMAGYFLGKRSIEKQFGSLKSYSKKVINEAHQQAKTIKKETILRAKDSIYQLKLDLEKETKDKRVQLKVQEDRLFKKESKLDGRIEESENRERHLDKRDKQISNEQRIQLEKVAGISSDEAKKMLMASMESEAKHDAAKFIRRIENETRENSKRKAQEILALAVKRYAGDYVTEKTVSVVNLPNEEMKGRIIGREGRNIRAIE